NISCCKQAPRAQGHPVTTRRPHLLQSRHRTRYLAPRPATCVHNRLCIYGGPTLFMPPTSAAET
ncbi:hypothetical protein ACJX0J_039140, partial [Zea mays]